MKDSNQSHSMDRLTLTAMILPVIVLLGILGGALGSDGAAFAKESPESTRISQNIDEGYFTSHDRLAQAGGLLQPRSDSEESEVEEDDMEAEENNDEGDDLDDSDNVEENAETENETATDSDQCSMVYLQDNLRIDFDNDRVQVLKLQSFLKTFEGYDYVSLSGTFDESTLRAVESFQSRYAEDVLEPWGYQADEPTGYVYITTKKKINEIYCDEQFLLSQNQQAEIRNYRQKLNDWRAQGASFETPQYLADYYGFGETQDESTDEGDVSGSQDAETEDGVTVEETPADETATTATSATSTEEEGGFFDWIFGGDDDEATTSTSTVEDDEDAGEEATITDEDDADEDTGTTSTTTATNGIDQMAAGVYTGINSIVNFLLSPTFLLIVLVILILLLIATLIEDADIEADAEGGESVGDDDNENSLAWTQEEDTTAADTTDAEVVETVETDETEQVSTDDSSEAESEEQTDTNENATEEDNSSSTSDAEEDKSDQT